MAAKGRVGRNDREFSLFIRERDRVCQRCGKDRNLQCAHIVSRTYRKTRWDPDNAMALCFGCHKTFTHWPLEWEAFVITRMGEEGYRELKLKAQDTVGPKADLDEVWAEVKKWRSELAASREDSR